MDKKTLEDAAFEWGLVFPPEMEELAKIGPDMCIVVNGSELPLPWPPLTPLELISAVDVALDWELAPGIVPVMGDFHDLVCLRYEGARCMGVVVIDDDRAILASFASVSEFLHCVRQCNQTSACEFGGIRR
jgi:hypothetical protein